MPSEVTAEAMELLEGARAGTLATLLPDGAPYASLASVATDGGGRPIFLLSRLALHTRNLLRDRRASLLLRDALLRDDGAPGGDVLAGTRVSLVGAIAPHAVGDLRARFLAAHPEAETYIDFADFGFYAMTIERAHLVAGFGRIVDIPGTELLRD